MNFLLIDLFNFKEKFFNFHPRISAHERESIESHVNKNIKTAGFSVDWRTNWWKIIPTTYCLCDDRKNKKLRFTVYKMNKHSNDVAAIYSCIWCPDCNFFLSKQDLDED